MVASEPYVRRVTPVTIPAPRDELAPVSRRDEDDTLVSCPACRDERGDCSLCGGTRVVTSTAYRSWQPPPPDDAA